MLGLSPKPRHFFQASGANDAMAQTDCRHFPTKGEMGICKMALRSILTLPTENISYPIPSDEDLWIRFLRHGVIAPHLPESQYPTLYGVFLEGEVVPLKELWERPKDFELPHGLLLDRET